jgi:polyferredoxin
MPRSRLKLVRLIVAGLMLAGLTVVFADLRGSMPAPLAHWLAAIQFVPALVGAAAGGAALVILGVILAVTLLGGRLYCSTVCPLGLLQDAVGRVAGWLGRRRAALRFKPGSRYVRYGMLLATVLTILLGVESIAYTHADPYSNFGRIVSALVRPVVTVINNLLVAPANALGVSGINQVTPSWPTTGILFAALFVLALVTTLAVWRRRLFCNTLCPVGTTLGLLSRFAAFRFTIDRASCHKCAHCLQGCKAQCIDLRTGAIDGARCVSCFNCLNECDRGAVRLAFAWRRKRTTPGLSPAAARTRTAPDPTRRAFVAELGATAVALAGASALVATARAEGRRARGTEAEAARPDVKKPGGSRAICPPGAQGVERFLDRCTGCNLCVSACPTHVLQPAFLEYGFEGMMKPRLDYTVAFCNFDCHRCTDVCPDGALTALDLATKHVTRIGEAHLDIERCIVKTHGTDCAACSEHCPTKALDTKPYGDNLRLPVLHEESCIGCGACEYACPAAPQKAVWVTGSAVHGVARPIKSTEAPPPPATGGDFPF